MAAIGLLAPAQAKADVTASVDTGQDSTQHKTSAHANGGRTSTTDSISSSVFYTITVRNLNNKPAQGVTLEYHFYNKKTVTNKAGTTITLDDITDSSTFDLDGNAVKTIETTDIPQTTKNIATSGNTSKTGVSSPGFTKTTITAVMGWVLYIKKGDLIVHTITSTPTVLDEIAQIQNKNSN
jgi:hypothetical protein